MFVLFRPHIEGLLLERDRVIEAWRSEMPGADVLEDRRLEILAYVPISAGVTLSGLATAFAYSAD
jgi:hypothetical protein